MLPAIVFGFVLSYPSLGIVSYELEDAMGVGIA